MYVVKWGLNTTVRWYSCDMQAQTESVTAPRLLKHVGSLCRQTSSELSVLLLQRFHQSSHCTCLHPCLALVEVLLDFCLCIDFQLCKNIEVNSNQPHRYCAMKKWKHRFYLQTFVDDAVQRSALLCSAVRWVSMCFINKFDLCYLNAAACWEKSDALFSGPGLV